MKTRASRKTSRQGKKKAKSGSSQSPDNKRRRLEDPAAPTKDFSVTAAPAINTPRSLEEHQITTFTESSVSRVLLQPSQPQTGVILFLPISLQLMFARYLSGCDMVRLQIAHRDFRRPCDRVGRDRLTLLYGSRCLGLLPARFPRLWWHEWWTLHGPVRLGQSADGDVTSPTLTSPTAPPATALSPHRSPERTAAVHPRTTPTTSMISSSRTLRKPAPPASPKPASEDDGDDAELAVPWCWFRDMHGWETAIRVPEDRPTVAIAIREAPPGAHILLSAGMHVLTETLVVDRQVTLIGELNSRGNSLAVLRHTQSVVRVANGGNLNLCGVSVWCHASDQQRRAAITVDSNAKLHTKHVQVKCVSGRYSSGIQVYRGGALLMHDSTVRCCTGSGIIIFGQGFIYDSSLHDNSFNGVEVQKGAQGELVRCHIYSNGYSNNEDDLGSGVTVYGEGSWAKLEQSCVHSNKGGGVLIHSGAHGHLLHSEVTMNHAGFEFGDVDVDTESHALLEHCELVGNGEHGREQYRVLAVQQGARLTVRHCNIRCCASSFGTGIEVQRGAKLCVEHSDIFNCTGSGILLRDPDTQARIEHSQIRDNLLHGLEVQAGEIIVRDSKLFGNRVHDMYISETNGECHDTIERTEQGKIFRKKNKAGSSESTEEEGSSAS